MANQGKRCVISDAQGILKTYNINAEIDETHPTVILDGAIFVDAKTLARHVVSLMRTANNNMRYEKWHDLPLAGGVLSSTSNIDLIKKTALVIEFAISRFTGIERQIDIKTNRYCVNGNYDQDLNVPYPNGDNLLRELQTAGWDASFLPIVIGATGEVLLGLSGKIKENLGISSEAADECIERMQRSAVLGTSRIIKNHLSKKAS
ncbi:unnamed protein product [Rotaria magnacalcarata]